MIMDLGYIIVVAHLRWPQRFITWLKTVCVVEYHILPNYVLFGAVLIRGEDIGTPSPSINIISVGSVEK